MFEFGLHTISTEEAVSDNIVMPLPWYGRSNIHLSLIPIHASYHRWTCIHLFRLLQILFAFMWKAFWFHPRQYQCKKLLWRIEPISLVIRHVRLGNGWAPVEEHLVHNAKFHFCETLAHHYWTFPGIDERFCPNIFAPSTKRFADTILIFANYSYLFSFQLHRSLIPKVRNFPA